LREEDLTMGISQSYATAAVAASLLCCPVAAVADDKPAKIGDLDDLMAWVTTMPPGPATLHVIGEVKAPTPCHDAVADYAGDDKSNPPVYRLKVTWVARPGMCIQKASDIQFRYTQPNYAGSYKEIEVFTDSDKDAVTIETAVK
jgi:hypothetical protein